MGYFSPVRAFERCSPKPNVPGIGEKAVQISDLSYVSLVIKKKAICEAPGWLGGEATAYRSHIPVFLKMKMLLKCVLHAVARSVHVHRVN